MAGLIEIKNVTKVYRMGDTELRALDGVTLSIGEGESAAIMGTSGSGKSTLMNLIGCLDRPTTGEIWLAGRDVSKMSVNEQAEARNKLIGFVFQNFNLLSRTTALENVELPLIYQGVGAKDRRKRAKAALERVGLGSRMDHTPSQLSGGQQQRVAIARAIVGQPKLILADEPTGALDSKTTIDVMSLMQELHAGGITIILVTHEPEVGAYTERLIVVKDGKVREDKRQVAINAKELAAGIAPVVDMPANQSTS